MLHPNDCGVISGSASIQSGIFSLSFSLASTDFPPLLKPVSVSDFSVTLVDPELETDDDAGTENGKGYGVWADLKVCLGSIAIASSFWAVIPGRNGLFSLVKGNLAHGPLSGVSAIVVVFAVFIATDSASCS